MREIHAESDSIGWKKILRKIQINFQLNWEGS